jgi:hypothetical protein
MKLNHEGHRRLAQAGSVSRAKSSTASSSRAAAPELWHARRVITLLNIATVLLADALRSVILSLCPSRPLTAASLFLRRPLALYKERGIKPPPMDAATRVSMIWLSRLCDWRSALVVVRPQTLVRWQ